MTDYTDKDLLAFFRIEEKKHYAFNSLVGKYQERIYWHIRKLLINHEDTDDVVQNTFIKVWNNLADFREASQLYTWIYRIATNEALTFLNQKKRKFFLPIVDYEKELINSLEADEFFSGDEIQLKLQKAILGLPEKQRVVFNLKYFEEMAVILDTSVGALKASYHHAVKKIEKYLESN